MVRTYSTIQIKHERIKNNIVETTARAGIKTGLASCLAELEQQKLLMSIVQFLEPLRKSYKIHLLEMSLVSFKPSSLPSEKNRSGARTQNNFALTFEFTFAGSV